MKNRKKKSVNPIVSAMNDLLHRGVKGSSNLWTRFMMIKDSRIRIIIAILTIASLWMLSGIFKFSFSPIEPEVPAIEVKVVPAEAVTQRVYLDATGTIDSNSKIMLKAESNGNVLRIIAKNGQFLKKGEAILEIDPIDANANYAAAEAALKDAELKLKAAQAMMQKGLSSQSHLEIAKSNYQAALAGFERAQNNKANTIITAPFDGYLDKILVNVGDLMSDGMSSGQNDVGYFSSTSSVVAVANVSREIYDEVAAGGTGMVTNRLFAREGVVRFKSTIADMVSRSYRIEMDVDNADGGFIIGEVVRIKLPRKDKDAAYKVPKSALNLDSEGKLVAKVLGEEDTVEEYPVEVISEDEESFVVKGLPADAKIISLGSQYVSKGDKVKPIFQTQ